MLLTLGAVGVLLNISQQGTEQSALLQERAFAQAADAVRAKTETRHRPPVTQTWRPEGR
jgi:hypothetical protein